MPVCRVHACTCVRLIILVLVCGIMYHIRTYLVSARYQPATKIRICRYVCARVGYVFCATYVRKLVWARLFVPGISRLPRYVYVDTYVPVAEITWKLYNKIIDQQTELCHHRPRTKAHSNEYENNTHKAEQALPAWRGAGRSSRDTKPSVPQRRCPQLSYSLAVSAAVLLKLLKKK